MVSIGNVKRFQRLDILFFCVFVDKFIRLLSFRKREGIDLVICGIFFLIHVVIVSSTFGEIVRFLFVFFFKGFLQIHYFCWNYPVQDFFLSFSGFFVGCGPCQVHFCVDPCLLVFNVSSHKHYEQCVFFFFGWVEKLGRPFSFVIVFFERFIFIILFEGFFFVVFLPC